MSTSGLLLISTICSIGACFCCYKIFNYLDGKDDERYAQMSAEFDRDLENYYRFKS